MKSGSNWMNNFVDKKIWFYYLDEFSCLSLCKNKQQMLHLDNYTSTHLSSCVRLLVSDNQLILTRKGSEFELLNETVLQC